MLTWSLAIVNGLLFSFSIWFSRVHDFSQWWHWVVVITAGILVVVSTTIERRETERYRREQIRQLHSISQESAESKTAMENAVNTMKDEKERKKVSEAIETREHYYEEIIKRVGEARIVDDLSAVATGGLFPSSGSVRDVIPKPQFGKPNDDVSPNGVGSPSWLATGATS